MAAVHVRAWQQAYRGLISDGILDAPDLMASRLDLWNSVLSDQGSSRRVSAALARPGVVGIAMAGPATEFPDAWQLSVLYLLDAYHGSGLGAWLLSSVLPSQVPVFLWVADPNPRAQAFYRREGFVPDGAVRSDADVRERRMVRGSRAGCSQDV